MHATPNICSQLCFTDSEAAGRMRPKSDGAGFPKDSQALVFVLDGMMYYNYVDGVNANLICCICRAPFVEPTTTTTCSHTFCRECILRTLDTSQACPIDRSPLDTADLRSENLLIRNMVDELAVECPHRPMGCMHVCQRQLLGAHLRESCQHEQVACSEQGCDQKVLRKDLGKHSHDCIHRVVACDACGSPIAAVDRDAHLSNCVAQEVTCEFCSKTLLRSALVEHNASCPRFVVPCTQSVNGCPWTGPRNALESIHLSTCPYESIKGFFALNNALIATLVDENRVLKQKLHGIEAVISSLRRDVESARRALGPWWRPEGLVNLPMFDDANHVATLESNSEQTHRSTDPSRAPLSRQVPSNQFPAGYDTTELYPIPRLAFNDPDFLAPYFPPVEDTPTALTSPYSLLRTTPSAERLPTHSYSSPAAYLSLSQRYTDVSSAISPSTPGRPTPQSTVAPVDLSTTLEGALSGLRNSIITLSASIDSVVRRQDIALKTENLRMAEEMGALRAVVHGLRMQVHGIMMERNNQVTGRLGEGTHEWSNPPPHFLNHPHSGFHQGSMPGSSITKL